MADQTLPFVIVSIAAANLATNFPSREVRGVDISVSSIGLDYLNQRVEVAYRYALYWQYIAARD